MVRLYSLYITLATIAAALYALFLIASERSIAGLFLLFLSITGLVLEAWLKFSRDEED